MEILGGGAHNRGVTFISVTHIAQAKRDSSGDIVSRVIPLKTNKLSKKLRTVPFLRGLGVLINVFLMYPTVFVLLIALNVLLYILLDSLPDNLFDEKIVFLNSWYLLFIGALFFLLIKRLKLWKYHAAEHQVYNALYHNKTLDIETVKREQRTTVNCGSNLVLFFMLFYYGFTPIVQNDWLLFLISFSFAFEILKVKNKYLRFLLKPFFILGNAFQYFITTSAPTEKELEVAIKAVSALKGLEYCWKS